MRSKHISRRDFFKLLSILPLAALPFRKNQYQPSTPAANREKAGIIILVFDSFSAANFSLNGYPRQTTPNIERFAQRANVYHANYSPATFTTPGTASLLSGSYPWSHRAFHYSGHIAAPKVSNNIFRLFNQSTRLVFSQNPWVDLLFYQFTPWIDKHIDAEVFNLTDTTTYNDLFSRDPIISFQGVENYAFRSEKTLSGSILTSLFRNLFIKAQNEHIRNRNQTLYPFGIPEITSESHSVFDLKELFDGLKAIFDNFPAHDLKYLHIFPPHYPYTPYQGAVELFQDGWTPIRKEQHPLASKKNDKEMDHDRLLYDAFVYSVDTEFGRLLDFFEANNILENNYIVLTSDHGEIFERGEVGHTTSMLYEPLVRVPLLISSPGQKHRQDYHTPTSNIDILPTLLSASGLPIPEFCQGQVLPGWREDAAENRPVFFIDAKSAAAFGALSTTSFGMRKGSHKIIKYYDFPNKNLTIEVYDLANDPEELANLAPSSLAKALETELDAKFEVINQPFRS
ncbi:MAG: sulfatase-like hydrolase/transferase [Anaerolineales bacterium]|nr:sulfatase-like hydrolase/transferase [Anaerolineales bacterium]